MSLAVFESFLAFAERAAIVIAVLDR